MSILMRDLPPLVSHAPAHANRVAVLEDKASHRNTLLRALQERGFSVRGMASAAELYRRMLSQQFDIVVLGLHLPDEDGLSVAQHLRATLNVGIVVLSDWAHRDHHIRALQHGADAYLTKPIDADLLAATLHNLARRLTTSALQRSQANHHPSPARWRLDTGGWRFVSPDDQAVALTASERCILTTLVAAGDDPVSREALADALIQDNYHSDPHRLEMIIYRLRRKVPAQTGHALPLITVRGKGYMLLCNV